jgi:hypothetical protein
VKVIPGNTIWLSHSSLRKIASVEPEQRKKEGIYEETEVREREKEKCSVKSETRQDEWKDEGLGKQPKKI